MCFYLPQSVFRKKIQCTFHSMWIIALKNAFTIFRNKIFTWWKILNIKTLLIDKQHHDSQPAEMRPPNDSWLDFIIEFRQMAFHMTGSQCNRIKQLFKHSATTIHHTSNGNVSLCRLLLATSHKMCLIRQFTTDLLTKEVSKFQQGSGGTYFVNV